MERFSPKLEIINHFDDLIQQIDIEMETVLSFFNENHVFGDLDCFKTKYKTDKVNSKIQIKFLESCESSVENKDQTLHLWSESTKVIDYLKQIRMELIEELRKEQKESVENSSRFKSLINADLTNEEKRSELFAEKFYFQVKINEQDHKLWLFNIYTFVTDFYMSQSDINLLQYFFLFYIFF